MTTRYEQLKNLVLAGAEHQLGEEHWRKVFAELEDVQPKIPDKLRRVAAECREAGEPEDRPIGEALALIFDITHSRVVRNLASDHLCRAVIQAAELMYEQIQETEK